MMLVDVERFLRSTGMSATRFGRNAVNDPRFVLDLRMGRQPRETTVMRVRRFIERHKP